MYTSEVNLRHKTQMFHKGESERGARGGVGLKGNTEILHSCKRLSICKRYFERVEQHTFKTCILLNTTFLAVIQFLINVYCFPTLNNLGPVSLTCELRGHHLRSDLNSKCGRPQSSPRTINPVIRNVFYSKYYVFINCEPGDQMQDDLSAAQQQNSDSQVITEKFRIISFRFQSCEGLCHVVCVFG